MHEYAQSEALEHEAEAFFRTLADLTSKAGGPLSFNAKAFHDTDVYKRKAGIQKRAHQYIKIKQQEETAFLQKKLDRTSDPGEYVNIAEELGADNMNAEQLQYYSSLLQLKAMRQAGQMLIDGAKGIMLGIWDAGKDAVIGAYDIAVWLQRAQGRAGAIEQAKAGQELISAIYSAPETFDYMVQSFKASWNENIIHGDTYSRTHYIAYAVASLIGAKGAGKVTGVTRAGRFVTKEAKTFIADQKNAAARIYAKGKSSVSQPWQPAFSGIGEPFSQAGKAVDVKQESVVYNKKQSIGRTTGNHKKSFLIKGDLHVHESKGGHLIERHVGKSDEELIKRLEENPKIKGASTFTDQNTAQQIVDEVLHQKKKEIEDWLNHSVKPTQDFSYNGQEIIGRGVKKGSTRIIEMKNAKIVLKRNKDGSFILTGYPVK
ncbi:hypothetical protein J7E23_00305 [Pseudomonas sp. ISL-88]|uniref:RNase A-like domain-containing protein n=1 Tax=Bacteria TaxID=2 RepID=UPI001BEBE9EB|nr:MULTISPECIES: RNase A-like domain-containing protein [Bacteria]MBT2711290.1 hypothetical protein [Pseudomonas sp. ISL-88]